MSGQEIIKIHKLSPENKICVDCNTRGTTFVDVKFGSFLCIRCAGIHREFGTDISRVKSVTLDNFSIEELSMFTYTKGNAFVNKEYEAKLINFKTGIVSVVKPDTNSDNITVREYIRRKYVVKQFYERYIATDTINAVNTTNQSTLAPSKNDTKFILSTVGKSQQTNQSTPKDEVDDLIHFDDIVINSNVQQLQQQPLQQQQLQQQPLQQQQQQLQQQQLQQQPLQQQPLQQPLLSISEFDPFKIHETNQIYNKQTNDILNLFQPSIHQISQQQYQEYIGYPKNY